jgi:hypothetical protein
VADSELAVDLPESDMTSTTLLLAIRLWSFNFLMSLDFTLSVYLCKVSCRVGRVLGWLIYSVSCSRLLIISADAAYVIDGFSAFTDFESFELDWFIHVLELRKIADLCNKVVNAFKLFFFRFVWMMWMWIWLVPVVTGGSLWISISAGIPVGASSFTVCDAGSVRCSNGVLSENAFVMLRLELSGSCLGGALFKVVLRLWGSSESILEELLLLHIDRGHSSRSDKRVSGFHFE